MCFWSASVSLNKLLSLEQRLKCTQTKHTCLALNVITSSVVVLDNKEKARKKKDIIAWFIFAEAFFLLWPTNFSNPLFKYKTHCVFQLSLQETASVQKHEICNPVARTDHISAIHRLFLVFYLFVFKFNTYHINTVTIFTEWQSHALNCTSLRLLFASGFTNKTWNLINLWDVFVAIKPVFKPKHDFSYSDQANYFVNAFFQTSAAALWQD